MEKFLNGMKDETNFKFTENGAVALESTKNALVDAFGSLGSMRSRSDEDVLSVFYKAFSEDRALAIKMMFWLRDCRGGAGERRAFRVILKEMASKYPKIVKANLMNIPFYGRYDDLMCLLDTPLKDDVTTYIKNTLLQDIEDVKKGNYPSLLAKWLPSENTSNKETVQNARIIIKALGVEPKVYRKTLSILRDKIKVVENLMSHGLWNKIEFDKVPSRAALSYARAFFKHQPERYKKYMLDVAEGKAKINAGTLFPVDIIKKVWSNGIYAQQDELNTYVCDAMWNNLPNYFEGLDETGLCVVDVSGSMYGTPIIVAIALGMYCADKAKGAFKDHFITFSKRPQLQKISGANIFEKVRNLARADWDNNTNLEAVFDLILTTAIKNNCKQDEIPNKLYIISDMEFDRASRYSCSDRETFIESMRRKFEKYGYTMPQLVYWNVDARNNTFHQNTDETGFCMVSGYSASLFKSVILGTEYVEEVNEDGETVVREKLDPVTVMENTLNSERYDKVVTKF